MSVLDDTERLKRYIKELEDMLDEADDGYTFGCNGWTYHLSEEAKETHTLIGATR